MEDSIDAAAYTSVDTGVLTALFDSLVRVETRLYNALNDALRTQHGIVTSQLEFLHYLDQHPAARVGDLASKFALGVGSTSKGIDRLAQRGWVARVPDPADRRSSFLHLTAAGHEIVDAAQTTFEQVLAELVGGALGQAEAAATASALARLRASLEAAGTGTPAG